MMMMIVERSVIDGKDELIENRMLNERNKLKNNLCQICGLNYRVESGMGLILRIDFFYLQRLKRNQNCDFFYSVLSWFFFGF